MVPFGHASFDICSAHDPRCAHASLRRWQLFQPNQPQHSGRCNAENIARFADRHFVAGLPFSFAVDRNRMIAAQGADTLCRPYFSMCRAALIPIQDRGDSCVRFDPRQYANDLHEILVGDIAMRTAANLLELHLGVISSLPMQHEPYGFTLTCGDDLFQRDAKEALLVLRPTMMRMVPKSGKIPREFQHFPFLCVAEWALSTLL